MWEGWVERQKISSSSGSHTDPHVYLLHVHTICGTLQIIILTLQLILILFIPVRIYIVWVSIARRCEGEMDRVSRLHLRGITEFMDGRGKES